MEVLEQLSAFDLKVMKKYFLQCSEGGGSMLNRNIGYYTTPL
jgi:hypothetical protein